jgi:hypothetical protein
VIGKRAKLKNKRHYYHYGTESFWEGFETFLIENYDYDPLETKLIINGDGAPWIRASKEYFRGNSLYVMDRFHVARAIRTLLREHPRYRQIRIALKNYDVEQLILELNSTIGTLKIEEQEKKLEEMIHLLEQHKESLVDYREWLKEQGIDITGMRPMGSAEATMSVFAKRLKNGRSWSDQGIKAMVQLMVGIRDQLSIKTLWGRWEPTSTKDKGTEVQVEKVKRYQKVVEEVARQNIPYLQGTSRTPIYKALKALSNF